MQETQLADTWERVLTWASDRGITCARARPLLGDKSAAAWLGMVAVADEEGFLISGPALVETLRDAFPRPVALEVFAGDRRLLQVYESWDGILVYPDTEGAARQLAARTNHR